MRLAGRFPAATSLAAGLVMPLAFAPFDLFFLAPLALAWLFPVWIEVPLRRRVAAGFAFGLGMFGAGVSWVYVSLHDFGNMPPVLAAVCVAGFVAFLALYPAAAALATGLFDRAGKAVRLLVVFPALWVGVEIARNHLFTGFSGSRSATARCLRRLASSGRSPVCTASACSRPCRRRWLWHSSSVSVRAGARR
ncbi:MAG: hypothetical protein M5U09_23535 [Gammaproteobacteria bacterium]|nr:hypothetical protein [Gammaproteobacteria bacterium]